MNVARNAAREAAREAARKAARKASVAFRLGRVSNLPTVWTNVLAAVVLGGGEAAAPRTLLLMVAMSLFYGFFVVRSAMALWNG